MNNIEFVLFFISFLIGIIITLTTNLPPHYIVKLPNVNDIYKDNNNRLYKYRLKYIS